MFREDKRKIEKNTLLAVYLAYDFRESKFYFLLILVIY